MKIPFRFTLTLFLLLCLAVSCKKETRSITTVDEKDITSEARFLTLRDEDGYSVAEVLNPWKEGETIARYIIPFDSSATVPDSELQNAVLLKVNPRLIVYNSVHATVIEELGALSRISGVVDADYFSSQELKRRIAENKVVNCGNSSSPSPEAILSTNSSAILLNLYEGMDVRGIDKLGLPIIKGVDNMESTPLGQAEWIRFYGRIVGQKEKADSIFFKVKDDYNALKDKMKQSSASAPRVLTENIYQGVWYVAGGDSYLSHLIADAGGDYIWKDKPGTGSIGLTFEEVLQRAVNADIWLLRVFGEEPSKESLIKTDKRYYYIPVLEKGGTYYCNTKEKPLFEDTAFHPERLLKEYSVLFGNGEPSELRYYKRVK